MTKQEFLAMSLPYNVRIYWRDNEVVLLDTKNIRVIFDMIDWVSIKPILHPLSDLTKEIEHKGEKFNPSYKLGTEIIEGFEFYKPSNFDLEINIETPDYSTQIDLFNGFLIVQKLIEWHFDIAELISNGEAIDVNTLKVNPYK